MRAQRIRSIGIALIFLVWTGSLLGGCVSKQAYEDQVDQNEELARLLDEEKARRGKLEEELTVLKGRFEALQADLAAAKEAAAKGQGLKEGLQALEGALDLAGEMGDKIDKNLQGNLKGLKEEYNDTLEMTKKEIARFKNKLEGDEDLRKLRKEILKQAEELLALVDEFNTAPGKQ